MAVGVNGKKRIFTIRTKQTTYQMMADAHGVLLHLYYGPRAEGEMDYLLTYYDRGFSGNPGDTGNERSYSLDALPQEYPQTGTGDYRSPALTVEGADGYTGCDLRYQGYTLGKGMPALPGLPAVYADGAEAETLTVRLADESRGIAVDLLYGVLPGLDIITRSAVIRNTGTEELRVKKALAASLDLHGDRYDVISFYGRHGMERNVQRAPLGHGEFRIGSRRGTSSHEYNPLLILADRETTETAGFCCAMEFVYSGGFNASAETDQYNSTRMQMGLAEHLLYYPLAPGEAFTVPQVIMTASGDGFGTLSQNLMDCVRSHVCRGKYRDAVRPVLLNSWEACYFDFNGEKLRELAKNAAGLGVDLLVLDDGWFGSRCDDNRALGDWTVNETKLGGPLTDLIRDVHAEGLKFGIWFEPEMVSEESLLFRTHPDWALTAPDGRAVRGRNQLVLDFSRPEVVDGIYEQTARIVDQGVDYLKWDYNRSIADVFTRGGHDQGRVLYDYILGLYRFLERLHTEYPDLLIEGCSGGGGRFDAGMLYYTPQIWCSDNTDAIDRIRIQYGTSFGYPVSAVGAHVSAVPNEQCGRVTSLAVRGLVAMAGTFGYELDPARLTEEEKAEIRQQISDRNRCASLIAEGRYFRLTDRFRDPVAAWCFVSRDGTQALVCAVTLEAHCNSPVSYIRIRGLQEGAVYENAADSRRYPADGLMNAGLPVPLDMGEYRAYRWELHLV